MIASDDTHHPGSPIADDAARALGVGRGRFFYSASRFDEAGPAGRARHADRTDRI